MADLAVVAATVFTDPFCPWCWGAEPQLRRLQVEFGEQVAITFVIVGAAGAPAGRLVCGFPAPPAPPAPAELWRLAQAWRVRPRTVVGGGLWEPATG